MRFLFDAMQRESRCRSLVAGCCARLEKHIVHVPLQAAMDRDRGPQDCPRMSNLAKRLFCFGKEKPAFLRVAWITLDCVGPNLNGGAGGNRTPVHKSYATRSTYVAQSIVLTAHYPTGRESVQPARYFFVEHTPGTCVPLADERYTQTFSPARDAWVSTAIRRLERSCLDWQL